MRNKEETEKSLDNYFIKIPETLEIKEKLWYNTFISVREVST